MWRGSASQAGAIDRPDATDRDLSRRMVLRPLNPFSLREYLFFKQGQALAPLTLEQIFNTEWTPQHMRAGAFFEEYLQAG